MRKTSAAVAESAFTEMIVPIYFILECLFVGQRWNSDWQEVRTFKSIKSKLHIRKMQTSGNKVQTEKRTKKAEMEKNSDFFFSGMAARVSWTPYDLHQNILYLQYNFFFFFDIFGNHFRQHHLDGRRASIQIRKPKNQIGMRRSS